MHFFLFCSDKQNVNKLQNSDSFTSDHYYANAAYAMESTPNERPNLRMTDPAVTETDEMNDQEVSHYRVNQLYDFNENS